MPPTILIAGAATAARQQLAGILQGHYELRPCLPEELRAAVQERPPDLLLMVGDLPGLHQVIRQFKEAAPLREIPIVIAFPEFSEVTAAWALEAGADEFLLPPFEANEVLGRLAVVLRLLSDRRLLLDSHQEFSRIFQETGQPLFFCDRVGAVVNLNPALRRFLGYPGKRGTPVPMDIEELLSGPEDRDRFRQMISEPGSASHVKLHLKSREGHPITVLLNDLTLPEPRNELRRFQVQPVGAPSSLKRALQSLVAHLIPSARDYLALLQMTPLLGERYEKVRKLGQGSFGEVWLVMDTEATGPGRQYVAKIPFLKAANPKFRKEAAILQKLAPHPGVARLIETLEDEGKLVLIQEYVEGRTLSDLLDQELPRPLVERIILQLIDVVAHAHKNRIMHRDIKPGNIIIQPDGTLKLLDYGVAKILGEKDISSTMVGSRPFMAPEQIMGRSERRSDIWAIGVLMYLLYTGEPPFYREVEKLLIDQILEQEPEPPRKLTPDMPAALEAIILRCLQKDVDQRYPSAVALKHALLRKFPHYGTQTGRWPWIQ